MAEIQDFDPIDDNNVTRWPENMLAAAVNNAARADEGILARFFRDTTPYATCSGTSTAYTLTPSRTISSLSATTVIAFRANVTCGTAPTFNLSGLGAYPIKKLFNSPVAATDIQAGQVVVLAWDPTNSWWQMLSHPASGLSGTDISARILKCGSILPWPTATAPAGWLICDGSAISRTTYAELFSVLGTIYGTGDGSTTFNIPDYRGYSHRGLDTTATVDPDVASRTNRGDGTTGANVGTKQADQTKSHTHANTLTDPGHTHPLTASLANSLAQSGPSAFYGAAITSGNTGSNTTGITITNASSGGNETRGKNVAVNYIILANPTAAAAGALGVGGFSYNFNSGTGGGDPGSGKLAFNNATLTSATTIYISETDAFGANLASAIQGIPANSVLYGYKVGAPATYFTATVSATATDAGVYDTFTLSSVSSSGTFSSGDGIALVVMRAGITGATGPAGGGIPWNWDTTTTASDPGSGKVRGDNATLASITNFYISTTDANGASDATWIDALDDSTSTVKGYLQLVKSSSSSNNLTFRINSVTGSGSWRTISVTFVGGAATFAAADSISFSQARTGDIGSTGAAGTDAGMRWNFATSTSMADPSAGNIRFNNATLASVTALAISYSNGESGTPSATAYVQAWDDSSTTAHRGYLVVKKASAAQNFVVFDITAALTDNTTWAQFTVSYVSGAGSFSAADTLSVQFVRTGDAGAGSLSSMTNHGVVIATGATSATSLAVAGAGTVLGGVAASDPAFTATPTLGVGGTTAGTLAFSGLTSGTTTVQSASAASGTLTLPAATDTLVGKATTDTLTNKTYDTAGAGNVLKINGTQVSDKTGTGKVVLDTSPTLTTPTLGAATATTVNKLTLTAPATGATLTLTDGKTVAVTNTLTFSGTDSTTMTFPSTTGTVLTRAVNANLTGGATATSFSIGSPTNGSSTTLDGLNGQLQYLTNNVAGFTLVAPAADTTIVLYVLNGASAGTITWSGFTGASFGDAFTTTNTNKFMVMITRINSVATYINKALQ